MKRPLNLIIFAWSLLVATQAIAEEQTVTLEVNGMTCAACPYMVKETLAAIEGVAVVEVSFADRIAIVTYDDSKTQLAALTQATANMGFPSSLKE